MAATDDLVSTQKGGVQNLGQIAVAIATAVAQYLAPGNTLSTTTSPRATNYTTLSTTSVQVIASSTTRRGIAFYNSNPSGNNIFITPSNLTAVINQGIPLLPGGAWEVSATLAANAAFNAIAATASNNVLTIIEFF